MKKYKRILSLIMAIAMIVTTINTNTVFGDGVFAQEEQQNIEKHNVRITGSKLSKNNTTLILTKTFEGSDSELGVIDNNTNSWTGKIENNATIKLSGKIHFEDKNYKVYLVNQGIREELFLDTSTANQNYYMFSKDITINKALNLEVIVETTSSLFLEVNPPEYSQHVIVTQNGKKINDKSEILDFINPLEINIINDTSKSSLDKVEIINGDASRTINGFSDYLTNDGKTHKYKIPYKINDSNTRIKIEFNKFGEEILNKVSDNNEIQFFHTEQDNLPLTEGNEIIKTYSNPVGVNHTFNGEIYNKFVVLKSGIDYKLKIIGTDGNEIPINDYKGNSSKKRYFSSYLNPKVVVGADTSIPEIKFYYDENPNEYINAQDYSKTFIKQASISFDVKDISEQNFLSSGLKKVEYILKNKNNEVIYNKTEEIEGSFEKKLNKIFSLEDEDNFEGDFEKFYQNRKNLKLEVKVSDGSGNIGKSEIRFKVLEKEPEIEIKNLTQKDEFALDGNFNKDVNLEIHINDETEGFNKNGLQVFYTKDKGVETQLESKRIKVQDNVFKFGFSEEGEYRWRFVYVNNYGIQKTESGINENFFRFTIDKTSPTAEFEVDGKTYDKLATVNIDKYWKNSEIYVTVNNAKVTGTDISNTRIYVHDGEELLNAEKLNQIYRQSPDKFKDSFDLKLGKSYIVYLRAVDNAGNIAYISTDRIILENESPKVEIKNVNPQNDTNDNGYYNSDIKVDLIGNDNVSNNAKSGLKSMKYKISYFDGTEHKEDISQIPLNGEIEATKRITIDSQKYNYDNVKFELEVEDRAGNKSITTGSYNINSTKPTIELEFKSIDSNGKTNIGKYYPYNRQVVITLKDRQSTFLPEKLIDGIKIKGKNAKGEEIVLDKNAILSDWVQGLEMNTHRLVLNFTEDANYEWSIKYVNKAGSVAEIKTSEEHPFLFTVDKVKPVGTVKVNGSSWSDLLTAIKFNKFTNKKLKLEIQADDIISPNVHIDYYIQRYKEGEKIEHLTYKQLSQDYKNKFVKYDGVIEFDKEDLFAVYARLTDNAGNMTFLSSDGLIIDKTEVGIDFNHKNMKYGTNVYNEDIEVELNLLDKFPFSGIKQVKYYVESEGVKTKEEILFDDSKDVYEFKDLISSKKFNLVIDSKLNNSSDVVLTVEALDNAGNITKKSIDFDIDIIKPVISIEYDNNDYIRDGFYRGQRTATLKIKERGNHFNPKVASEGILITAYDSKNNKVDLNLGSMIGEWKLSNTGSDEDIQILRIKYTQDANYRFEFNYRDSAGNLAEQMSSKSPNPYMFTVDNTAPVSSVTAKSGNFFYEKWNDLLDKFTFGLWSNSPIFIRANWMDKTSPIESVKYYKSIQTKPLSIEELKNVKWQNYSPLIFKSNQQFAVYIRVEDKAGNVRYVSTNTLILDNKRPLIEKVAPEITIEPQPSKNGIYNKDLTVDISVEEPIVKDTYSGIKQVEYVVKNMGEVTQRETVYAFNNKTPDKNELLKSWKGRIKIDSSINNSNDVLIEVYATDNASNRSIVTRKIKIDTTRPEITVDYDNNTFTNGKYYAFDRTATITVKERNFDPNLFQVEIKNKMGVAPRLSSWNFVEGSGNGDNRTYTATILYNVDGDFNFEITGKDEANNIAKEVVFTERSSNPKNFIIDKTRPEISVEYDNNSAKNEFYFKDTRVATVTVKEKNFDLKKVNINIDSKLDDRVIPNPEISWSQTGDNHIARIVYDKDGDYKFDINMTDLAENKNNEVLYSGTSPKSFTIDKTITKPKISGVENNNSYTDEIKPLIEYFDINLENHAIKLYRTRRFEIRKDVTDQYISHFVINKRTGNISIDKLDKVPETDGIYELDVKIFDKAGNEVGEKIFFTVNRFGSIYVFDEYISEINDKHLTKIEKDLIIKEFNPNKLIDDSIKIIVTSDGKQIEDVKYTVTPPLKSLNPIGPSGWYEKQYIVDKSNFAKDGIYTLSVASVDEAGNYSETEKKELGILFRVDTTKPELVNIEGMDKAIHNAISKNVKITVFDAIALKKIDVYVNDKLIKKFENFEDLNNFKGEFELQEGINQHVRIVAEDMSGNILDTDEKTGNSDYVFKPSYDFIRNQTVSTNIFVRFYANKPLFFGTIIFGVAACSWFFIIIFKRRKDDEEEEQGEQKK